MIKSLLSTMVVVFGLSGCATNGRRSDGHRATPLANAVRVEDGHVDVAGFRFADAVIARLDETGLRLRPSAAGGVIRLVRGDLEESGTSTASSNDATLNAAYFAESVTIQLMATGSLELRLSGVSMMNDGMAISSEGTLKLVIENPTMID